VRTDDIIALALREDVGSGDITVDALVPKSLKGVGRIQAKEKGILGGIGAGVRTFTLVDPDVTIERALSDGDALAPGDEILVVRGRAASLLKAERTALNFLQRLSGVATLTRRFVEAVDGTSADILDTRKTTPGMRLLEKEAVRAGGGTNHRMGLYDMVLIKDNHLEIQGAKDEVEAVKKALDRARAAVPPGIQIEVEVRTAEAAVAAAQAGADMILLDNMTPAEIGRTVNAIGAAVGRDRPRLEASGGITLENVRTVAEAGVDRISVGALTHSAEALDIAMYISFD
jgi:nicotinate-nucleotide pyrophosphorylase (carboxylating)